MAKDSVGSAQRVANAMLKHVPCPQLAKLSRTPNFDDWPIDPASSKLMADEPNAFLIGGVFDRLIRAERAWDCPRLLKERLGHLDVRRIARMHVSTLESVVRGPTRGMAIHRLPNEMARCVVEASKLLVSRYDAHAENIWSGDPGAREVLRRLDEFRGISQKIANMMVRLLVTYYGVRLSGWQDIDVAVDRHVARVFLRSGLVDPATSAKLHRIGTLRSAIIDRARELSPRYPGALDEPAFLIGLTWCTAKQAMCEGTEELDACPLIGACSRKRVQLQVV